MTAQQQHWICQRQALAEHPLVKASAHEQNAQLHIAPTNKSTSPTYIGWGRKPSGQWAATTGKEYNAPVCLFEDAFVRSLKPGSSTIYGIVQDHSGIYYDAKGESDLIKSLQESNNSTIPNDLTSILERFRETGTSKYNWYPDEFKPEALDKYMPNSGVLVVDQTLGDESIPREQGNKPLFETMLNAALIDNPGTPVYIRAHPDHIYRGKESCIPTHLTQDSRVKIIPATLAPWQTFERTAKVYVATSLLGMEALVHSKEVVTFSCSFYSHCGLTDDRASNSQGQRPNISLETLFNTAYCEYSKYFDPDTAEPCSLSRIMDHIELQKDMFKQNARHWVVYDIPKFKHPVLNRFLRSPAGNVTFTSSANKALESLESENNSTLVLWGSKPVDSLLSKHKAVRTEDGFLRSNGLGAGFRSPMSLVFDDSGIYYNPKVPSKLERILSEHTFKNEELIISRELINYIIKHRITKYNLPERESTPVWPAESEGRRILVPGQVDADASIQLGAGYSKTSNSLLQEVRSHNPDAVIAYKPHPDVAQHLRRGAPINNEIESLCDIIIRDDDIVPWLESCDEVHTITSLTGFEGLIRGKKVYCYGAPFYAGWNLTHDMTEIDRRGTQRSLEELVAATLLIYPRYVNPSTGEFTNAMSTAQLLAEGTIKDNRTLYLRFAARLKQFAEITRRRFFPV